MRKREMKEERGECLRIKKRGKKKQKDADILRKKQWRQERVRKVENERTRESFREEVEK